MLAKKIRVTSSYSDYEEGYIIAGKIAEMRMLGNHYSFSDFAILYRTNAQSRILEKERCVNEIFLIKYMGGCLSISEKR